MIKRQILLLISSLVLLLFHSAAHAQDTLKINLTEFLEKGLDRSGQVAYESRNVELARNRSESARGQRILPSINLNTQHGVIPGVVSQRDDLSQGEYYLDPNLTNDWEDWAIFTRAELSAVQPIYSWGAIDSAIKAAEAGAKAAEHQFDAFRSEAKLQLFELYYSFLLSQEISRIMDDAEDKLRQVSRRLEELLEEGDPDLKESDMFKFEILETEFEVQKEEVNQSSDYIRRVWNYILADNERIYEPEENFLDPAAFELENYEYYEQLALQSRPELRGVDSGIEAARNGRDAVKSQQYPMLFLGITGSYANTPNRPRQTNPFIINSTNYASAGIGIGIRQNLNFFSMRRSVERAEIEHKKVNDLRNAVHDGIILDLNDLYREAVIAEKKVQQTEAALDISRNWVRNEQLNYDIGFGDAEDLLDAIQKELELRVDLKQNIFELNKKMAALYKGAGIPIENLSIN